MTPMPNGDTDTRVARLEQRVTDMGRQVETLNPLATTSAAQAVVLSNIEDDLRELRREVVRRDEAQQVKLEAVGKTLDERGRDEANQARTRRNAVIAAVSVMGAAAIGSIGSLVAVLIQSGGHP